MRNNIFEVTVIMKTKALKSFIALVLTAVLCSGGIVRICAEGRQGAVTAVYETGEASTYISIDKTYLKAGCALPVINPSNLDLEYYVGEERIGGDELVLSEEYYESFITIRAYDAEGALYEDSVYFSKLPVIYIDTDDGRSITSKSTYKSGSMFIQNNTESAKAEYNGVIQIKGRGNTSWSMPKKPYRIKLDKKADLFGMGSNKNWVLIANYLDECFLRNKTAYELSRELGLEYMDSTWCDLILNGEFVGNYVLCEQIRIDETRVNIYDWENEAKDVAKAIAKAEKKKGNVLDGDALEDLMKSDLSWISTGTVFFEGAYYSTGKTYDNISGGYLFELSDEYDEASKFMTSSGLKVMLKSPEFLATNQELMDHVQEFWQNFEDAYCSEDGYVTTSSGERVHYSELADLDSMVAYWLVIEIMGNVDAVYKSRYAYMDTDSLLKFGPAWDFDWGCGSSAVAYTPEGWKVTKRTLTQCIFKEWVDDPLFIAKATEKYWEIRPYLESLIEDNGTLDQEIAYLTESGLADEARWDRKVTWPNGARGFELDAEMFKEFMVRRIAWLDRQFATDKAAIGNTYTTASGHPYQLSGTKLNISISSAEADTYSEHAPANGVVFDGVNTNVAVTVSDPATTHVNVYINGLYFDTFELTDGDVEFTVGSDLFSEQIGKKNVITADGKDQDGSTTYRNYFTVIEKEPPEIVLGDVNGDGRISSRDLVLLKKVVANIVDCEDIVFVNADINGDGSITSADVAAIKRLLAELD